MSEEQHMEVAFSHCWTVVFAAIFEKIVPFFGSACKENIVV